MSPDSDASSFDPTPLHVGIGMLQNTLVARLKIQKSLPEVYRSTLFETPEDNIHGASRRNGRLWAMTIHPEILDGSREFSADTLARFRSMSADVRGRPEMVALQDELSRVLSEFLHAIDVQSQLSEIDLADIASITSTDWALIPQLFARVSAPAIDIGETERQLIVLSRALSFLESLPDDENDNAGNSGHASPILSVVKNMDDAG